MEPRKVTDQEANDLARRLGKPARCCVCGSATGPFVDRGDVDGTLLCIQLCLQPAAIAAGFIDGPQSQALREHAEADAVRIAELEGELHALKLDARKLRDAEELAQGIQRVAGLAMRLAPNGAADPEPTYSGVTTESFD
jgi:hypothetical protein